MISGVEVEVEDLWTLQNKNRGMNRVRAREKVKRRLADQTRNRGCEQRRRPMKSPTLKTKKWTALKRSRLVSGFTGMTEIVIGGKTAYTKF